MNKEGQPDSRDLFFKRIADKNLLKQRELEAEEERNRAIENGIERARDDMEDIPTY